MTDLAGKALDKSNEVHIALVKVAGQTDVRFEKHELLIDQLAATTSKINAVLLDGNGEDAVVVRVKTLEETTSELEKIQKLSVSQHATVMKELRKATDWIEEEQGRRRRRETAERLAAEDAKKEADRIARENRTMIKKTVSGVVVKIFGFIALAALAALAAKLGWNWLDG